jgi:hypothetical protein
MRDLRELLDNAAGDPPDLLDIEMVRQRARPRIIRRRAASIAALMAVGVAGLAGISIFYDGVDQDRGRVVQPATPSLEPTAQTIRPGQLEPGTYRGQVGAYSFVLDTYYDEWKVSVDRPEWVAFTYRQYVLHLQTWGSVVPPDSTHAGASQAVPADVAQWLGSHPRLSAGPAVRTVVGGLAAAQVDTRVVTPLENPPGECSGRQCVVLARVAASAELVDVPMGQRARFLIVGQSGQQLLIFYRAPEREFSVLDQAVQELLAGLRLTAPD